MKTESRLLAVIAAAALFAFSLANPAFAETQEFTQAQEQSVRSNMTSLGIDGPTQDSLIVKMESGLLPDSLDPDATPVQVFTFDTAQEAGEVRVYADGSRTKVAVQEDGQTSSVPQRGGGSVRASEGSITKCTVKTFSGGSSHRGCLVKMSTIVYVAVFNADYTLVNGGNSYISSAYGWGCAGFGCSIEKTGITKKKADLNGPAKAEMRVRVAVGPLATTGYLQLFVKGSRAWTN